METGWTRSKIVILLIIVIGSLTGVSMYIYGWRELSGKENPNALYWLLGGFAIHILFMGVIPQILKKVWNKRG